MKDLSGFQNALRQMISIEDSLRILGVSLNRVFVLFSPRTKDDPTLHGAVIVMKTAEAIPADDATQIVAVIHCGPTEEAGDEGEKSLHAQWSAACAAWNELTQAEREAEWRQQVPRTRFVELAMRLVVAGELDGPKVEALLKEQADRIRKETCTHESLQARVSFDEEAAKGLDVGEIRRRWPRVTDRCPDCDQTVIVYASMAHYVYGDW